MLKVGFDPDQLVFYEDDGEVRVCAVILTPLNRVADNTGTVLVVFSIFAEPGTAQSRPPPPITILFYL